jgi:hypothetical protein
MAAAASTAPAGRRSAHAVRVLRVLGAGLLLVIAGIHGYLWQQGYRDIETIGPAFLLQTALGVLGAIAVLLAPRRLLSAVAAAGALFSLGSLAALIASTTVGVFGFTESTQAEYWWESFWAEIAGTVVLTALAVLVRRGHRRSAT